MKRNYPQFLIDTNKALIQAAFAGLFIASLTNREISRLFIVLFVIVIILLYLWSKTLCESLDRVQEGVQQ